MTVDLLKYGLDGTSRHTHGKTCTSSCDKNLQNWDLGYSLVLFIANDSTHKLDAQTQTINGGEISAFFSPKVNQALYKSKYTRLRNKLGVNLSLYGKHAMVVDIIDGMPFISLSKIGNFFEVAGELVEYWGDTMEVHKENDIDFPIYERWYFEDGRVKKFFGYQREEGAWVLTTSDEPFVYPANITRIPVKIFENNSMGVSDIDNTRMWTAIEELNYHAKELRREWDMTKTSFLTNKMFGTSISDAEFMQKKAAGDPIPLNDVEANLGRMVDILTSGSATSEIVASNINFIEDKILKYTFTSRDTDSSGTNKHNAEIATFNQFAIEYLENKKEVREEDYADFYAILSMFDEKEVNGWEIKVELKVSQLVQNLIDSSNPETPEVTENTNINEDSAPAKEEE